MYNIDFYDKSYSVDEASWTKFDILSFSSNNGIASIVASIKYKDLEVYESSQISFLQIDPVIFDSIVTISFDYNVEEELVIRNTIKVLRFEIFNFKFHKMSYEDYNNLKLSGDYKVEKIEKFKESIVKEFLNDYFTNINGVDIQSVKRGK